MRFKEFNIKEAYNFTDLFNIIGAEKSKDILDKLSGLSQIRPDISNIDDTIATKTDTKTVEPSIKPLEKPIAYPMTTTGGKNIVKVLKAGSGYNVVQYSDGSIEKRTGARNWRNNNPGNIKFGPFAQRNGAIGSDGTFAIFPNYDTGSKAKESLVFGPSYINLPIQRAVAKYAPEKDNNDVVMYTNSILKATGAAPNTLLKDLTPQQRQAYLATIDKVEGFKPGMVAQLSGPTVA